MLLSYCVIIPVTIFYSLKVCWTGGLPVCQYQKHQRSSGGVHCAPFWQTSPGLAWLQTSTAHGNPTSINQCTTLYMQCTHIELMPTCTLIYHLEVFAGLFPSDQSEHSVLKGALEKLILNDSSVTVTTDSRYLMASSRRNLLIA